MNVFAAAESDLALRIRRALGGGVRRMGVRSRVLAAILLCGMAGVTLPYSGIAQTRDGVDWETVKTTPPEQWSEELKAQIAAAGHDVEAIAERVRQGQAEGRDEAGLNLEDIGRRIRAAVERGDMTPEEGREKMEAARQAAGEGDGDRLREFQRGVVARAMAAAPESWSDELKAAVVRAGWDLEEFTEGIRQRQAVASESSDSSSELLEFQIEEKTAVEKTSWGRLKKEHSDPK